MTIALLGTLIGLALIDSTSIGTVGVPVMLTLAAFPDAGNSCTWEP